MDKLKFVNEPVRLSTTTTTRPATTTAAAPAATTGAPVTQAERGPMDRPAATTATTTTRPVRATNEKWYPDHAILSGATKDSLNSMTEFKYN